MYNVHHTLDSDAALLRTMVHVLVTETFPFDEMSAFLRRVLVSFVAALYRNCCCVMSRIQTGYGANSQIFGDSVQVCSGTVRHTTVPQPFHCRRLHNARGACTPFQRS